jgi:alpha-L-fucosidase 2
MLKIKIPNTCLYLKTPASWWGARWREALPSGNGTLGAAVYGAVHDERVLLTHEDLWHGVKTQELPDVSACLPEVRELLAEGNAARADRVLADKLDECGYEPEIGYPLPLADLRLRMPVHKGFRNYRRVLDMGTGEVAVEWKDGETACRRRLFVSRPDDLVVMGIDCTGGDLEVDFWLSLHDLSDRRKWMGVESPLPERVETVAREGGWIRYAARNDDGMDFGAVVRVVTDGTVIAKDDTLFVREGTQAMVLIRMFVGQDRQVAWPAIKRQLGRIHGSYDELLLRHAAVHGEMFHRVRLDLGATLDERERSNEELLLEAYQGESPAALIEKMWAFGRYLLISSSRSGGQPCHLHGNWFGEYEGFWAFNMANENLQMIYWQALPGNLAETILPVFDYFDRMLDDFRTNARRLYGCRGIYVPAVTTPPSGLLKTVSPHIIHWTGAAAWIAHHYFEYFSYTGDKKFLRERALPFLRETAQFYEDFFTTDAEGFLVSAPSNSPENTPGNYWDGQGMGSAMETTINATMDFALAKEVLTNLLEGVRLTGLYADEVPVWEEMLGRIPPYQVNADGAVREWMHPFFEDNYHHRHMSHIYPVFPGIEVTAENDPELFAAFETAIRKRLQIGISEQTGWSLAHMARVFARMRDGDQALECLDLLARSCVMNNFFTTHNDWRGMGIGVDLEWAPFQIDANMGWTSAVQHMLLSSADGRIHLLPALPKKWVRGSVRGMRARSGIEVSITWEDGGREVAVELISPGRAQRVTVVPPQDHREGVEVELAADSPTLLSLRNGSLLLPEAQLAH